MSRSLHQRLDRRRGFTLVELLMAIAIIGVLVALTVAGVNAARTAILKRAIALEAATLAQAVEAYKQKYGEYPPDGSRTDAFVAHFRSVFPNIAATEFIAVYRSANSHQNAVGDVPPNRLTVMDPAEAMVFCLGGFSNDPQYPFTGTGGPLYLDIPIAGGAFEQVKSDQFNKTPLPRIQYNVDRNEGFFPFGPDRLSIDVVGGITVSTDESALSTGPSGSAENDLMPVYIPRGRQTPIVYFAAATYNYGLYNLALVGQGAARPYRSSQNFNTTVPQTDIRYYRFMNDKSFQIISAGLDDHFGGLIDPTQLFLFPSGVRINFADASDTGVNYQESTTSGPSPQLDNVTNFSEGPLESSLP